jgi:hypothetical protein
MTSAEVGESAKFCVFKSIIATSTNGKPGGILKIQL